MPYLIQLGGLTQKVAQQLQSKVNMLARAANPYAPFKALSSDVRVREWGRDQIMGLQAAGFLRRIRRVPFGTCVRGIRETNSTNKLALPPRSATRVSPGGDRRAFRPLTLIGSAGLVV